MMIDNLFGLTTNNNRRLHFLNEKSATERLSSGLRINYAAEDPSGLGISSSNRAIIGGLSTAIENVQDGIKMIRTSDGAMSEIHDLLQRGRDIAVRAANTATLTTSDLQKLQNEVDSITAAINEIANGVTYNTKYLINGGNGPTFSQTTQADWMAGTYNAADIDLVSSPGSVKLQPLAWDAQPTYGAGCGIVNNHINIFLTNYVDHGDGTISATLNVDGCGAGAFKGDIQLDSSVTINSINNVTAGTNLVDMGGGLVSFSGAGQQINATNSTNVDARINFTADKDAAAWAVSIASGPGGAINFYHGATNLKSSIPSYTISGYFTDMTSNATFRSSGVDTGKVGGTATLSWNGTTSGGTNMMMRVYEASAAGGPWTALGMYENGTSFDYSQQFLMAEAVLTSAGIAFGSPSLDDLTFKVEQGEELQVGELNGSGFQKTMPLINATAAGLGVNSIDVTSINKVMKQYDTAAEWQSGIISSSGIDYLSSPGSVKLNAQISTVTSSQAVGTPTCYIDIESATARPDGQYDVTMSFNMYGCDPTGIGTALRWLGSLSISDGNGAVSIDTAYAIDHEGAGLSPLIPMPTTQAITNDSTMADATRLDRGGAPSVGPFNTITFDYGTTSAKDGFGITFTCAPDAVFNLNWDNLGLRNAGGGNTRSDSGDPADAMASTIYFGPTIIAQNVGTGVGNAAVTRRLAEYAPLAAPTGTFTTGPVYYGPSSDGQLSGVTNGGNTLFQVEESIDGIGGWSTILNYGAGNSFTTSAGGNYVRVTSVLTGTPAAFNPAPYSYTQSTTPTINTMTIEKSVSPITEYNTAINNLSDIRGDLGVIEKELNSILNTLSDQKINYIAANSRILDADFAREYVDLTKANILSQSVNAVSAQGDPLANGILNLFDNTGVGNGSMKTPEELANT